MKVEVISTHRGGMWSWLFQRITAVLLIVCLAIHLSLTHLFNIGQRNAVALREILARNGVTAAAMDIGGQMSRTVRLDLANGQVSIRTPGQNTYLI